MLIDRALIEAALPQYEVGQQIGQGAFGLVFTARHRELGSMRAVKAVALAESGAAGASRRFLVEAQVMTELDHPHIVRVHEYTDRGSVRLLVMEYLAGGTLTDRLRSKVPPEVGCAWALSVADALQTAHERGVLHRDIKPDNLLFTVDGLLKVSDFGVAKLFEGSAASASVDFLGTPLYVAPEQITGGRCGPRTDLYALGTTLYQLLTGRTPFPAAAVSGGTAASSSGRSTSGDGRCSACHRNRRPECVGEESCGAARLRTGLRPRSRPCR
jgi:serine/threonine protein kinase